MHVTLVIGVACCLAAVVIQTESAMTAAKDEKSVKKEQLKKKLAKVVAEVAKNNKPLTDEDMKKGKDLLTNGPKQEKMTLEELKKEEKAAEKDEKDQEALDLEEGDEIIDLDDDDQGTRRKRNAIAKSGLWPDPSKIPYLLSNQYTDKQRMVIAAAIEQFNMYTCIRFIPKTTESHYLTISKIKGCYARLGKTYNAESQVMSLVDSCVVNPSTPEHEFMHVLGFNHEQTRPDRDQYVTINMDNVVDGKKRNFKIEPLGNVQSTKYEYESVMHYGKTFFSKDPSKLWTIVTKDPAYMDKIGHAKGFSQTDVDEINMLYCGGKKDVTVKPLCYDDINNCNEYLGMCKWDPKFLAKCMESCNQCSKPPGKIPCADAYPNCNEQAKYCMWSKDTVEKCPKSCNQCSNPPGPLPCSDYWSNCGDWASACTNKEDAVNYKKARENCPKTCNTCPKAAPTTAPTTSTAAPTTSTAAPTTSTAAPTTSTAAPTTSTAAPTTSTAAPTTSTAAPSTSTAAPTTSTAAPTTSTAAPSTSTAAPTTSTAVPTTSTAAPSTSTAVPTTSTAAPSTSTAAPTTSTAVPTTSTAAPSTSTAAPTTSTAAPTTSTAAPTTSTAAPTTSTAAPTTSTAAPTTSTAAPTTSTAAPTTSTAAPTTSTTGLTTAPSTTLYPITEPKELTEEDLQAIGEAERSCKKDCNKMKKKDFKEKWMSRKLAKKLARSCKAECELNTELTVAGDDMHSEAVEEKLVKSCKAGCAVEQQIAIDERTMSKRKAKKQGRNCKKECEMPVDDEFDGGFDDEGGW